VSNGFFENLGGCWAMPKNQGFIGDYSVKLNRRRFVQRQTAKQTHPARMNIIE
jgi:hypothetical protein